MLFPATSGCFHRCSSPTATSTSFTSSNQQQEETCRKNGHPAGVKGRGPRLPVTAVIGTLVSKQQLRFQTPPPPPPSRRRPPPVVLMFQLCLCVSSDSRHGSRLLPLGRGGFQPPLSIIHLYIIRQGPAHKDSW